MKTKFRAISAVPTVRFQNSTELLDHSSFNPIDCEYPKTFGRQSKCKQIIQVKLGKKNAWKALSVSYRWKTRTAVGLSHCKNIWCNYYHYKTGLGMTLGFFFLNSSFFLSHFASSRRLIRWRWPRRFFFSTMKRGKENARTSPAISSCSFPFSSLNLI